jgi:bifunctional enzyme CysN/CysC/sulfate adenylyltransferase subunit 1
MIVGPVAAAASFASTETTEASLGDARRPALILLPGRAELAVRVRDALIARGERAVVIDDVLIADSAVAAVVRALDLAGVIAVSSRALAAEGIAAIEGIAPGAVRVENGSDEEAIIKSLTGRL